MATLRRGAPSQEQGSPQPQDVYLGEETLDEMCLGVLNVIYRVK